MKEEITDKTDLDQHFERERNAAPAVSLEETESLVALKGESRRTEHRKKEVKKNVVRMLIVAAVLLISFAGYRLNQKREVSVQDSKTDLVLPEEKAAPQPTPVPAAAEPVAETKKTGDFPPAYPEENISRPEHITQPVKNTAPAPQKISMQTPGEATVTFTHDDKKVKLVLLFDDIKDLYIDEVKIDPAHYGDYKEIVAAGKKLELDNRKNKENNLSKTEREQQQQNEIILNSIIKSLARDELIAEGASFDFRLQWNKLFLNDQLQPTAVYEKYKALYEEASGQLLTQRSNIHIRH